MLRSSRKPSVLPSDYGLNVPLYDPGLPLPSVTLGQLSQRGDLDQASAYAAMKSGQVPSSIQSRYFGYQVEPGARKDFQTKSQTAYSLYLDGKLPEHEALDAIYSGQVPDALQDRFPEIEVLPGSVDEDPSFRFWNAFGLGSLANPNESLFSKIGLMTGGGGLLNILGKPFDIAQTEILHALDPSDKRTFEERLLRSGETDITARDNFFHSGALGSRLDPDKYAADAKQYDHNGVTQAGAGLLRLAGLDGLVEAVNDDTDKPAGYRIAKGAMSVGGAASQVLPFAEAGVGRGLSAAGRGLGRGLGRGAKALGRGVAKTVRGPGVEAPYGKGLATGTRETVGPYVFSGAGEADVYASAPAETPLRMGTMDELAREAPVEAAPVGDPLGLPAPTSAALVDPATLLERDPVTLSGAEKDALFDFRRAQRKAMSRLSPAPGLLGDEMAVDEASGLGDTDAAPAPDAPTFDRSVTDALKTSRRRLSDQALFTDTRDVLGRAQAAESLADETLAGMKQTSLAADQLVTDALEQWQDAPDFDDAEPEAHPFRRGSRLRQGVRRQGSAAFARLYGEEPGVATGEAVVAGPVEIDDPSAVENQTNAARAAQLRKIEALKEDLTNDEINPFRRVSDYRRPVKPGGARSGGFKRQGSVRGSLAAPKRGLADLNWGKRPQSVVKQLGLDRSPWEAMSEHINRYEPSHGVGSGYQVWLERNQKASTPDTYHQYLVMNHQPLLSDYGYEYGQPNHGYYQRPALFGEHEASLMASHQGRYGLGKPYQDWLGGRSSTPKAYHDFVRDTQAKPLYQRLGYVA